MLKVLHAGTLGTIQPHPPRDKQGYKKLRVYGAGRERPVSSGKIYKSILYSLSMLECRIWFGERVMVKYGKRFNSA